MSVQSSIDNALTYLAGATPVRVAYKRIITTSGGDSLLGISGTTTHTDTQLTPQPVFTQLGDRASVLSAGNLVLAATDFEFTVSSSALAISDVETPNMTIVLKGPGSVVEEFRILGYNPAMLQGNYIAYTLYARSKSRQ